MRGRKVGQSHIRGIDFFYDLAVRLGFLLYAFPVGIVLKRFPVRGGCFAAGMVKDVDQCVALVWLVGGNPVGDALHSMLVKNLDGMFAEARQQVGQFSRGCVIDAKFVYAA